MTIVSRYRKAEMKDELPLFRQVRDANLDIRELDYLIRLAKGKRQMLRLAEFKAFLEERGVAQYFVLEPKQFERAEDFIEMPTVEEIDHNEYDLFFDCQIPLDQLLSVVKKLVYPDTKPLKEQLTVFAPEYVRSVTITALFEGEMNTGVRKVRILQSDDDEVEDDGSLKLYEEVRLNGPAEFYNIICFTVTVG